MGSENSSLKRELIKIVVDKALIGLIMIGIGFYSTKLIEEFKSERAFSGELNKIRAEKVGEVWEKVYLYETESDDQLDTLSNLMEDWYKSASARKRIETESQAAIDSINKYWKDALQATNKNRFWIGESNYSKIYEYLKNSLEYYNEKGDFASDEASRNEKLTELKEKKEKSRISILELRNRLLGE